MSKKSQRKEADPLAQIGKLVELRSSPELVEAWQKVEPFLRERRRDLPKQFFELTDWVDVSEKLLLIIDIMKYLPGNLPVEKIAERITELVCDRLGFGMCLVSILDPVENVFVRTAQKGIPKKKFEQMAKMPVMPAFYKRLMQERFRMSQSFFVRWWFSDSHLADDIAYVPPEETTGEWHAEDILLVPMFDNNGVMVGVISGDKPPGGRVPDHSLLMALEILAAEAGKAIEEARIYEKTERRLAQMEFLYEISTRAALVSQAASFFKYVCELMRKRFQYLWVGVLQGSDRDETLYMAAQDGLDETRFRGVHYKIGNEGGVVGIVAASGQHKIVNDIAEANQRYIPFHSNAKSELAVPIRKQDKVLGVLVAESEKIAYFSNEDRQFMRTVANQLASALTNISATESRDEELRIRHTLFEVGTVLSSIHEPIRLFRKIMDILKTSFNYSSAALFLVDEAKENLILKFFAGKMDKEAEKYKLRIGTEGVVGLSAGMGKPMIVPDVGKFPMYRHGFVGVKSELAVPIKYHDEILGILDVESEQVNAFGKKDEQILELFAAEIAVAIANAQLYKDLEALAVTDGLTELYNYRAFTDALGKEMHRANRLGHPLALLFADLDYFKRYNDTHGHPQGDSVLKAFADVLRREIREEVDFPARYGGEEFAVILPETSCKAAQKVADRIRQMFVEESAKNLLHTVTVSFGVACFPEHGEVPEILLKAADTALYRAKSAGRNRTCIAISERKENMVKKGFQGKK